MSSVSLDPEIDETAKGQDRRPTSIWHALISSKWYVLTILFFVYLFNSADRAVVGVIAEALKRDFHLTDSQLGLLNGFAYSVPYALTSMPLGMLIDRRTRTKLLSLVLAAWSAMTAMGAFATGFGTLILARIAVGATEAGAVPASLSILSDTFPCEKRGTAVGVFFAAAAAAQLVAFVGGGLILAHFTWRGVFLMAGLPGLLLAVLVWFTFKEPIRGRFDIDVIPDIAAKKVTLLDTVRFIVFDPPLRNTMLGNMISTGVEASLTVWAVSFFVRIHGVELKTAAIYTGLVFGIVQTISSILSGPVVDRFAKGDAAKIAKFPAFSSLAAVAAGWAMFLSPTLTGSLICFAALTICASFFLSAGPLLLISVSSGNTRGSILALSKLFSILAGSGIFALYTGMVSDFIGGPNALRIALIATFPFMFLAAFHYFRAGIAVRRRVSAAESA